MIANDLDQTLASLVGGLGIVVAFMGIGLAIAQRQRKLTVVDTMWGLGFVLVAAETAFVSSGGDGDPAMRWILLAMVAVWGGRLSWHLHRRNSGQPEDPRYRKLAETDGRPFAQVALMRVFVPQGIAMWLVGTPIMVGANNRDVCTVLLILGVAVWAVGLFFEAVGDAQLAAFKRDPDNRGKLMDQGLWRYTRHPNYFGDACVWTGIWLVAAGSWAGLATVVGPIAMTIFLTKVTGAALNEKGMKMSKPGYDEYVRRTSGFVPRPPKKRR
jgi:steroid 5-alpha reductase family enzyme